MKSHFSRKAALLFITAFLSTLCLAQVPIQASLQDGTGSISRTAFLHFDLENCGANFPNVPSNPSMIVQPSFDIHPATPGQPITGSVIGNDQITCGNVVSTYWQVTPMKDSVRPLRDGVPFILCSGSSRLTTCSQTAGMTFNPTLAQPMTGNPPAPGFVPIFANPVATQTWNQPVGTTAIFLGTFDFTNATVLGISGGGSGAKVSINGVSASAPNFNSSLPVPGAGITACTFAIDINQNVTCTVPTRDPTEFALSGSGLGSTFFIGFQSCTTVGSCPAISILQQAGGGITLNGPISVPNTLFSTSIIDLMSGMLTAEVSNCVTTGTTASHLAKLNGSCAVITTTSDTDFLGIATVGSGTSGAVQIVQVGRALCVFDAATTNGDYVIPSTVTGGDCHDTGSTSPPTQKSVGRVLSTNGSAGTYTILASIGGAGGSSGGGISGLTTGFLPMALTATSLTNSPVDFGITIPNTLTVNATGGLNLPTGGTPVWTGTFGSCPTPPGSTQSAICFGATGVIQGSLAGSAYQPVVFQNNISGSWINSGIVDISFLNTAELNANYLQTAQAIGTTSAAALADADLTSAPTGSGICTDANSNLTTLGCPAGSGAANTALSNVALVTAFGSNLQFAAGFGTISTTSNGNLSLLPNGTGSVVVPGGSASNPAILFTGDTAGNGLYLPTIATFAYAVSGTPVWEISNTGGFKAKSTLCFNWSSNTNASGGADTALGRVSAGVAGLGTSCGATNAKLELGNVTLEGASSGSASLTASATGGNLNLNGTNATVTPGGTIEVGVNSISFSTSPVLNMALGNVQQFSCTTPSSAISPTTSNLASGQIMTLIFIQNSGTACTLTYPTNMHGGTVVGNTLSGINVQRFVVSANGTDLYAEGAMSTNMTGGTP